MSADSNVLEAAFGRDMDAASAGFEAWLKRTAKELPDVRLISLERPAAAGLSHEILRADIAWREAGAERQQAMMVRLDPVRYRKRHASNLRREFDIQHVLGTTTDIPVAKVHWYEGDASIFGSEFYVMNRVEGRTLADNPPFQQEGWMLDLPPEERRKVWVNFVKMLGRLHTVPLEKLTVLRRDPSNDDDLGQNLAHWKKTFDWATADMPNPTASAAWDYLLANRPTDAPKGLSWGDAHPRNMMYQGVECAALLDWEDTSLAGPLYDLGRWFLTEKLQESWGLPRMEGLPSRQEVVEMWEAETGYSTKHLRWYALFNCCCASATIARSQKLQVEIFGKTVSKDGGALPILNGITESYMR